MLGDALVGIEGVDNVEIFRHLRRLLRQVGSAAAAHNKHVDLVTVRKHVVNAIHGRTLRGDRRGVTAGKDGGNRQIGVLRRCAFNAAGNVAVAVQADSNHNYHSFGLV